MARNTYYGIVNQITKRVCEELGRVEVTCLIDSGEPWYKAKEVAKDLKCKDTNDGIRKHVADDFALEP